MPHGATGTERKSEPTRIRGTRVVHNCGEVGTPYWDTLAIDPTTTEGSDRGTQEGSDRGAQEASDRGTQELLSAPSADRCVNCESALASDQRYCLECGERRGKARFSFEAVNRRPASAPPPERRRLHINSSLSLILGVATLLLAMGVGVLIGHNSNTKAVPTASGNQTIKVEGLGNGANNNNSGSSNSGGKTAKTAPNAFKAPPVHLTPKVVKKVNQAASKVLGSGTKNLSQNPTQTVGGSCSGGAGCDSQTHKFSGNYFPGGG